MQQEQVTFRMEFQIVNEVLAKTINNNNNNIYIVFGTSTCACKVPMANSF